MPSTSIVRYLSPWKLSRDKAQQRLEELRHRDGDNCRRCRRPLRFDLPHGHDRAPKIERLLAAANDGDSGLDNLFLCHTRCNANGGDHTAEVLERVQSRTGR